MKVLRPSKPLIVLVAVATSLLLVGTVIWLSNEITNVPSQGVRLIAGPCQVSDIHARTLTATNGITLLCLTGLERKPLMSVISRDGSRIAYALPTGRTQPPLSGPEVLNDNMKETLWYVLDGNGMNLRRFPPADNSWLSLSVDGQYADVPIPCGHTSMGNCESQIYQIDTERLVCRYSHSLFFSGGGPNCTALPLHSGGVWNVQQDVDERGCEFARQTKQSYPRCSKP